MLVIAALLGPEDFGLLTFQLSLIAISKAVTISAFQDAIVREKFITMPVLRIYLFWSITIGFFAAFFGALSSLLFSEGNIGLIVIGSMAILLNS